MAAVCNRVAIIFFPVVSFYLSISVATDWMSTILLTHGVALVRI